MGARHERSLFRREGEYWTIAHRGHLVRLRHAKGLDYIAALLARPGEAVTALELAATPSSLPGGVHADRCRVRVTKAIRNAARRIAVHDEALAHLFERTIRTGTRCMYAPGPEDPVRWSAAPDRVPLRGRGASE